MKEFIRMAVSRYLNKSTPILPLEAVHVKNLRVFENREAMLRKFKPHGIGAEIGVANGDFSEVLLQKTSPAKLYLIDTWDTERYDYHMAVLLRFLEDRNVIPIKRDSIKAAESFPDNYFDWIYLDTSHTYEQTKAELLAYASKIAPDGIIAGHDYTPGNFKGLVQYGVIPAVNEFCINHGWEFIALTMDEFPSFAIKRL